LNDILSATEREQGLKSQVVDDGGKVERVSA